jgi:hypothetical protein
MVMKQHPSYDPVKGKEVIDYTRGMMETKMDAGGKLNTRGEWTKPPPTHVKLNTDGSYMSDGSAGAGMVLRDDQGKIIFAACRLLLNCADAVDAELAALEEGISLALGWSQRLLIVKTDCLEASVLIKHTTPNTSVYSSRIRSIRELLKEKEITIAKIGRKLNCVSHELPRIGRVSAKTAVWLGNFPPEVCSLANDDCNSILN